MYLFNQLMRPAGGWEGRGGSCRCHFFVCHPQGIWRGQLQEPCLGPLRFATSPSYSTTCRVLQEGCRGKNRKRQLGCGELEKIQLLPQEPRLSRGRGVGCCLCSQPATAASAGDPGHIERDALPWARDPTPQSSHCIPAETLWTDAGRRNGNGVSIQACVRGESNKKNELSVRKIRKAVEERKVTNQISLSTNPTDSKVLSWEPHPASLTFYVQWSTGNKTASCSCTSI